MIRALVAAGAALVLAAAEPARPVLHPLFGDDMVFPRDRAAPVWGWSDPGAHLRISLAGVSAEAVAGPDGRWEARLGPVASGGPYELVVEGPRPATCHRVMVGDVWLFAGQSNMAFGLRRAEGGPDEVAAAAAATGLRLYDLGVRLSGRPEALPTPGAAPAWRLPDPKNAGGFSAVAWFTGRRLQAGLGVPVGLVVTAISGSNIRAWMPEDALERLGLFADERRDLAALNLRADAAGTDARTRERQEIAAWWNEHDPGTRDGWQRRDAPEAGAAWNDQGVPGTWGIDGTAWLRCDLILPEGAAGKAATLYLGQIDDEDTTWVNGAEVGGTRAGNLRAYPVPAKVLVAGANRIAIRIWAENKHGRTLAAPGDWRLTVGNDEFRLPATWRRAASAPAQPVRLKPRFQGGNGGSTMIWNGGIHPLQPFAFAGVVWYQGEQDAGSPDYRRLLPGLVASWREGFADPALPVVLVGLPAFHPAVATPVQERLSFGQVRDDQLQTARSLPRVGVAVTTDLGDPANVHPLRKREVGERAAAAALAIVQGTAGGGGPLFVDATAVGGAMRVRFDHIGGGLDVRPGAPSGFALAGADGVWHHAAAVADGDAVMVSSPEVAAPVAVRYGWADTPPVTLYDRTGFPASPFRSDR